MHDFDKDTFQMLKSNDPEAAKVLFDFAEDMNYLHTIDWEGDDGNVLANNTQLKRLSIELTSNVNKLDEKEHTSINNLLLSIQDNKSIQQLSIDGNLYLDMAETLSIMSPFIENNTNLRRLVLSGFTLDSTNVKMLASALSNNKSIFAFGLNYCKGLTTDLLTQVVEVVEASGILRLGLSQYDMEDGVATTLGRLLCKSNIMKELVLGGTEWDENYTHVGSITPVGMAAISMHLSLENSSLEELDLRDNHIGAEGAWYLANGLVNNTTLKVLDLSNSDVRTTGGIALSEALRGNSTLEFLSLNSAMSPGLGDIILSDLGWEAFFRNLRHCAFRDLDLETNIIQDTQIANQYHVVT